MMRNKDLAEKKSGMSSERCTFIAAMITSFIGAFTGSGVTVALPTVGAEFSADAVALSRVVSMFLFGAAMFMLPMGRVADILGRRKIYTIGVALFIISNLIAGMSFSVEMLCAVRFLQGCILSMVFGTGMAILVSSHKPSQRGKIIGSSTAATYTGLSLGPVISGFICEFLGWRFIFFITAAMVSVSLWMISRVKDEWYGDKGARFDYSGTFCYMIAAPAILYGLSEISNSVEGAYLLAAGFVFLCIFIWMQLRTESPMLDMNIFRGNRVFTLSNLASMIHYSATFAVSFLMSMYLQVSCGLSPSQAGMFILLQPVMMALLSPKAGELSDRIQPGKVASVGMAITCITLVLMSFLHDESPLWQVGVLLVTMGIGFAIFSSPNNNAIMGAVSPRFYGTASSMLATMRTYGQAASMAIVTVMMNYFAVGVIEAGGGSVNFLQAMSHAYQLFALLSALGIVASLIRNRA